MSVELENQLAMAQQDLALLKAEYDEFVYIISHDLSAPLRQIEGFSEIIIGKHAERFDDKTKRHFTLLQNAVHQAKQILAATTAYSRLNTTAQPFTVLELNHIIADIIQHYRANDKTPNAVFNTVNLPSVIGEEKQIRQVLQCLIENALIYQAPDRTPHIGIEVEEQKTCWQFCISDNGIGVAENMQEKIFQVLKCGNASKQYTGIGMGLAIAKKILRHHGGDIWLTSETDQGSRFYFSIAKSASHNIAKDLRNE